MQEDSRLSKLLDALNEATERGSLAWEETTQEGLFRTVTSNAMIRLAQHDGLIEVELMDRKGKLMEEYELTASPEAIKARHLYEQARRSARKVDTFLDQLIRDVEARAS